jgi:hypothetical protein
MKSLFSTKTTKMFLKRKMQTHYQPYDYVINLEEGMQPPFGPIYNLLQDDFQHLENTSMKILKRGSFDTPNLQLVLQSYFSRKMMDLYACVSIIVD